MSTHSLLTTIPHRAPFLYVDEVVDLTAQSIVTRFHARPELDFFRGHYPENPIMPGVLICECCFQAGALLIAHRLGKYDASAGVPVLTRIQDARFRRIVRPGETLRVEVQIEDEASNAYHLTGRAYVGDELAVRVSFGCMLVKAEARSG